LFLALVGQTDGLTCHIADVGGAPAFVIDARPHPGTR
jgi:hypothetical protein